MRLIVEEDNSKPKLLIIYHNHRDLAIIIKDYFKDFNYEIHLVAHFPENSSSYDLFYYVNPTETNIQYLLHHVSKLCILIFTAKREHAEKLATKLTTHKSFKIVHLQPQSTYLKEDIEKIYWFSLSQQSHNFLSIHRESIIPNTPLPQAPNIASSYRWKFQIQHYLRLRHIPIIIVIIIFLLHFAFFIPLGIASYYNYQSLQRLRNSDFKNSLSISQLAYSYLKMSRTFYAIIRPTFLLFSQAQFPDDIHQLNETSNILVNKISLSQNHSTELIKLIEKRGKSTGEVSRINELIELLKNDIDQMDTLFLQLKDKLPGFIPGKQKIQLELTNGAKIIETAQKLVPLIPTILANKSNKKYLLLFANNMELRPGGGFIGSFGMLDIRNYEISNFQIYDVYDADGQLTAHIEPPDPIRQYLSQPNWYLRDSAFSPDFRNNFQQAQLFIDKTLNLGEFDGGILLTTTSIQYLLGSVGTIYLPDFNEKVNKDNFYMKTQTYAEKDFFPGSIRKKSFLSSIANQLLLALENKPSLDTFLSIKRGLDEKQIVTYFKDPNVYSTMEHLYWTGPVVKQNCAIESSNCAVDYIYPIDANLGVNKANFFISKLIQQKVNINTDGFIESKLTLTYSNSSYNDVFPGGTYNNYLQIMLPLNVKIREITVDSIPVDAYQTSIVLENEIIGFMTYIKPGTTQYIAISYELNQPVKRGRGVYQLIIQKQVGTPNSDVNLSITYPDNMYIVNKNFSPLVKDRTISYNTNLVTDKVFFIEFYRE
ncbi:MAG: DUF4012 domain-containing protein [Candidatus Roizmanbacteria bacterium]